MFFLIFICNTVHLFNHLNHLIRAIMLPAATALYANSIFFLKKKEKRKHQRNVNGIQLVLLEGSDLVTLKKAQFHPGWEATPRFGEHN